MIARSPTASPSTASPSTASPSRSQLIEQILQDPILFSKFSDRVYELLKEEIRNQGDRIGSFNRRV